jgi:hypothetical protein
VVESRLFRAKSQYGVAWFGNGETNPDTGQREARKKGKGQGDG